MQNPESKLFTVRPAMFGEVFRLWELLNFSLNGKVSMFK